MDQPELRREELTKILKDVPPESDLLDLLLESQDLSKMQPEVVEPEPGIENLGSDEKSE